MDTASKAAPETKCKNIRKQRGLALFRDHARQIVEFDAGVYWRPPCSDGSYAGTLPERPRVRHGRVRDNRPARGRATTPPSGAEVDSLRGVWVRADTLENLARRLGV